RGWAMKTRDFMRNVGCTFVGGLIVVGLISVADHIVTPETLAGRMLVGLIVGIGLWIVWLTLGLVVADLQDDVQRQIERTIRERGDYRMGGGRNACNHLWYLAGVDCHGGYCG